MSLKKKILYIGSLAEHSNSNRRFKSLQSLGNEVKGIDIDKFLFQGPFVKFHYHFNLGPGIHQLNKKVLAEINLSPTDILWIDNKSYLKSSTLKQIRKLVPQIKIINLVTDDITGRLKYQWRLALRNVKLFDCFFVQRKVNMPELRRYGAKKVELCYRSFDPDFHRPLKLNDEDKAVYQSGVGFVGTYEKEREEYVAYLVQNNIPVMVTGDGWQKGKFWKLIEPCYRSPSTYGESYIKTINGMNIALHFLRHGNRDEQDSRTFEIPACGVFMLAERSEVHASLFREGQEAVFFSSKEELLQNVKYYLAHAEERKTIARKGLARCISSGYSHQARLSEVLKTIATL